MSQGFKPRNKYYIMRGGIKDREVARISPPSTFSILPLLHLPCIFISFNIVRCNKDVTNGA